MAMPTRFYHRTTTEAAGAILAGGFRDASGYYLTETEWIGVWVSNRPLDVNEGAIGDALLVVEIEAKFVEPHEWVEDGKRYREFLVPAAVLNERGRVRLARADEC